MYGTLVVNSWVSIREGCDITYNVHGNDDVDFLIGGSNNQTFELVYQAEALRKFVELGSKALAEMDAQERAQLDQAAELSA